MSEWRQKVGCGACADGVGDPFPFTMAFQPIVDVEAERVFAYEALVRGMEGQSAAWVLREVTQGNMYRFDQSCRVKAIQLAHRLKLSDTGAMLSINFMPGAVYSPSACIQLTLNTAKDLGFPLDRLIFEITESEKIVDRQHLLGIVDEYRRHGFRMALDDFGAGYAGLTVLSEMRVEFMKLDLDLIRNIDRRPAASAIVRAMISLGRELGTEIIAEGIERVEELEVLRGCGVKLMQGFLFAKPGFETLPEVYFPSRQHDPWVEVVTEV